MTTSQQFLQTLLNGLNGGIPSISPLPLYYILTYILYDALILTVVFLIWRNLRKAGNKV